jgi:translin
VYVNDVEAICSRLREVFEKKNAVRENCLARSREIVRTSANAIRHAHRGDTDGARGLIDGARASVVEVQTQAVDYPDIYVSGYVQDAQKEFVEAACTLALIREEPLPEPEELGVEFPAYLNGLGECVGELRRHILDLIRKGDIHDAERKLQAADDVFYALTLFDYPEPLTGGLRRTVDGMRGILERTRGDVTNALRQLRLEEALTRQMDRSSEENES